MQEVGKMKKPALRVFNASEPRKWGGITEAHQKMGLRMGFENYNANNRSSNDRVI